MMSDIVVCICRPYNHDSVGLISNPRMCLSEVDGVIEYSFQIFYKSIDTGYCRDELSDVECYLSQLTSTFGFVVCPGIREYPDSIRFKTSNLVEWKEPFNRCFSVNCSQWHVPNNVRQTPDSTAFNCCKACKQLIHDIHQLQQASEKVSASTRVSTVSL